MDRVLTSNLLLDKYKKEEVPRNSLIKGNNITILTKDKRAIKLKCTHIGSLSESRF